MATIIRAKHKETGEITMISANDQNQAERHMARMTWEFNRPTMSEAVAHAAEFGAPIVADSLRKPKPVVGQEDGNDE